jgi:hypothetical protein
MSVHTPAESAGVTDTAVDPAELAIAAAEAVLSRRFGAPITLADPVDLGGSERTTVLRVRVASTPFSLPKTLVIKHYGPLAGELGAESFAREAVSYQLFTALSEDERMCPELFAHDATERLLVLEDLGRSPTLTDKLLGRDPRGAEGALLSWARSLGKLHASTAGREADFDALMRRLGRDRYVDPLVEDGRRALRELPELFDQLLGIPDDGSAELVADHIGWLLDGSKRRAFSPSDLCPENNLITGKGVRFLDFEGGGMRDVLLDAAYLRVPFPSCWCAFELPAGMSEAMLAAWRAEVSGMWPEFADDDTLLPQLFDAQLLWVWVSTWWFLPRESEDDGKLGDQLQAPRRGAALAARWRRLAEEADQVGVDNVARHATQVASAIEERHAEGGKLAPYPAFR